MEGRRYVPPGVLMAAGITPMRQMAEPNGPQLARVGVRGVPGRTGTVDWGQRDPDRTEQLRPLAPPWAGRPGMGLGTAYAGRA